MGPGILESERLVLGKADAADAETILRWRNDPDLKRLTGPAAFTPVHDVDLEDSADKVQFAIRERATDSLLGWAALQDISWTNRVADLSVYLGEAGNRRQGLGPEAISIVLRYGFDELNLHRIQLQVVSYNAAAIRAYEKLGFRKEGILREYGQRDGERFDLLQYGILVDEFGRASPAQPADRQRTGDSTCPT
jgi:RimJ/RimL family protein N-acetyltransferase